MHEPLPMMRIFFFRKKLVLGRYPLFRQGKSSGNYDRCSSVALSYVLAAMMLCDDPPEIVLSSLGGAPQRQVLKGGSMHRVDDKVIASSVSTKVLHWRERGCCDQWI